MIREFVAGDIRHAIGIASMNGNPISHIEVNGDALEELIRAKIGTGAPWVNPMPGETLTLLGIPIEPRSDLLPAWRLVAPDGSTLREEETQ